MKQKWNRPLAFVLTLAVIFLQGTVPAQAGEYSPGGSGSAEGYAISGEEQLQPGEIYWFDLSGEELLSYYPEFDISMVPAIYTGGMNAYVLNESAAGKAESSSIASRTEQADAEYGYTYTHSLFLVGCYQSGSWNELNELGLIFGRTYTNNDVAYTMRAPSGGTATLGASGSPVNNEFASLLKYLNDQDDLLWVQDTSPNDSTKRMARYTSDGSVGTWDPMEGEGPGYFPVLEMENDTNISVLTYDLNGGGYFSKWYFADDISNQLNIVRSTDSSVSALNVNFYTKPHQLATFSGWSGDDGKTYQPGEAVPPSVKRLTAIWTIPKYSITVQTEGGGTASASSTLAEVDSIVSLTATPNQGCHFVGWEVVSGGITISEDNTFSMPEEDVGLKAVFQGDNTITVTGATAEDRYCDGTDQVKITDVTLEGVSDGDDVKVDVSNLTGTLSGKQAGTYTSITLSQLPLTGAAAETYHVELPVTVPLTGDGVKLLEVPEQDSQGRYEIANEEELRWFAGLVNGDQDILGTAQQNKAANAILTANIELSDKNWTPIGNQAAVYTGTFDGAGYTIDGMIVEDLSNSNQGFVGYLGENGRIQNLTLGENCSVNGGKYTGGICGWNNAGTITGCTNKGSVQGNGDVGGICGHNMSTVENCTNTGAVTSSGNTLGGICGYSHTSLTDCTNSGAISGDSKQYVGGICGYIDDGTVSGCTNMGTVSGGNDVGGICGFSDATIINCTNRTDVDGSARVGGICGDNHDQKGTIQNCYSTGNVTGSSMTGAVCGRNQKSVENCYWLENTCDADIGSGSGEATPKNESAFATGEVAYLLNGSTSQGEVAWYQNLDNGKAKDDFPVLDSTHGMIYQGKSCSGDAWGYSNTEGTVTMHYFENGFCEVCGQYQPAMWNEAENRYEIYNAGQLYWFYALVNGDTWKAEFDTRNSAANGVLMEDITITDGRKWTPMGSNVYRYAGTFDGGGHTISGLLVDRSGSDYQGFVGRLDNTGIIRNLTLTDCSITGNLYVGGVCGFNGGGTIQNCHVDATVKVSGKRYVSGVCGSNERGTISGCSNNGTVESSDFDAGGICGLSHYGQISFSGNTGSVKGSTRSVGGIVGSNYGEVTACYNTGEVSAPSQVGGICGYGYGDTENCYWLAGTANAGIGQQSGGIVTNVDPKTAEQFASGEVAYLLNGSTSEGDLAWYQNLDNGLGVDVIPVLNSTHGIVYPKYSGCKIDGFSNTQMAPATHTYGPDGFCTVCGKGYQPARLADGVYQIENAGQLFWFAALVNGDTNQEDITQANPAANAVLTTDLDLSGREWAPIAPSTTFKNNATTVEDTTNKSYSGTFDGQGHTISNFEIRTNSAELTSGLFGAVTGIIRNLGVVNATFDNIGSYDGRFGALCGLLVKGSSTATAARIENCYVTGSSILSASKIAGAIAGANYGGTIENCFECGNKVSGHSRIGNLVGDNQNDASTGTMIGTVTNCYSDTKVVGNQGGKVNGGGVKDAEEFASGEVAYLLNGSSSDSPVWYQNLDNGQTVDSYPVLDSSHGIVYCIEEDPVRYSNDPNGKPAQIISVDITWGELSFTYSDGTWNPDTHEYDGEGWTVDKEDGNTVKVENNGNTAVSVSFTYTATVDGITGSFTDGENPVSAPVSLPANNSSTVYLILADKPENELMEATIGSVTVTIGGESE